MLYTVPTYDILTLTCLADLLTPTTLATPATSIAFKSLASRRTMLLAAKKYKPSYTILRKTTKEKKTRRHRKKARKHLHAYERGSWSQKKKVWGK